MNPPASGSWAPDRLLRRIGSIRRREGLRGVWFRLLSTHCYRRVVLLERDFSEPVVAISARVPVEVSTLARGGLEEYLRLHGTNPRDHLEERLAKGDVCYLARSDGRVVGCMWAARRPVFVSYLGAELDVAPDEVYCYGSFVAPDRRGLGVAPELSAVVLCHFREQGVRRAITAVIPENRPNLRSRAKTGFRIYARWGYWRLGPWRCDFLRPVKRR